MKVIRISTGHLTIVDDDIFDWINGRRLTNSTRRGQPLGYADLSIRDGKTTKHFYIHRVVMGAAPGQIVDHINRDTLDNRRSNLRFVTSRENAANARKHSGKTSSKYKGVSYFKNIKKWGAYIRADGRTVYLGYFLDEADAARAYNEAAVKTFGVVAYLNVIDESVACPAAATIPTTDASNTTAKVVVSEEARTESEASVPPRPLPVFSAAEKDAIANAPLAKPQPKDVRVDGASI